MVVKEKRGRRRYIAFEASGAEPANELLVSALQALFNRGGQRMPKLIQLEGNLGIVRCLEPEMKGVIDTLNGRIGEGERETAFRSLYASGTLKALRSRIGLEKPERPRG